MNPAIDPRRRAHRQPGLDLLRAAAILLVLPYHAGLFGFTLPGNVDRFGWIGVDLFFVLSGYLIGGQLLGAMAKNGRVDFGAFYGRRALRILPAYLAVLAFYLLLPQLREYRTIPPAWKFLTFTQNFGLRGGTTFSHAWSLCIEAQFYFGLPFVLLALRGRGRLAAVLPWTLVVAGIAIRALLARHIVAISPNAFGLWQQLIYYPTYARLDSLLVGVSLAALQLHRADTWRTLTRQAWWMWLPALAAIVCANILGETDTLSVAACALQYPLLGFGFGALLICAVSGHSPLSRVPIPGAAFVATIAYSVYLSHKIVIKRLALLGQQHGWTLSAPVLYLCTLAAALAVGAVLFFAVERPFLRLRQRLKTPSAA